MKCRLSLTPPYTFFFGGNGVTSHLVWGKGCQLCGKAALLLKMTAHMLLLLAPSIGPWAIPQKLKQGGGHQGESAHMRLLPDVELKGSESWVLYCTVVSATSFQEFPNHLRRSDILDDSIWSRYILTDAHACGYPGGRQIIHIQVDILGITCLNCRPSSDHKACHERTAVHRILSAHYNINIASKTLWLLVDICFNNIPHEIWSDLLTYW